MHLIRAIAFATAAAVGDARRSRRPRPTNASWWRLALAAPAISPDFALVSKHVCERGSTFVISQLKRYFPSDCKGMTASWEFFGHHKKTKAKGLGRIRARRLPEERMIEAGRRRLSCGAPDGLGHVGHCVVNMIADRRSPGPGARYFQQYVGYSGVYLRGVDGLGDGFAPSLYCHERDWLNAHLFATSNCKRSHSKQDCTANATCAWHEKKERCMENSKPKKLFPN